MIHKNSFSWFFVIIVLLMNCSPRANKDLVVEYERIFDSIPSVSGIAIKQDTVYMVSDDGTGIYKLNIQNFGQTKIHIKGILWNQYREPKSIKHDFESACFVNWQGKEYLMALGSGSKSTSRDSILLLNTKNHSDQTIISLYDFYKQIQLMTHTDTTQWNVEGITIAGDSLVICNRGNNEIITCRANEFFSWLTSDHTSMPRISNQKIKLPFINNHEARLSGVCTIDNTHLLFCASVEDTPDWTKDGPVLGSYFGIYSLTDRKTIATYLLKSDNNKPLPEKVESVDILQKTDDGHLFFLAAGDNDNGTSKLLRLSLH
jgi:hypothetical protein